MRQGSSPGGERNVEGEYRKGNEQKVLPEKTKEMVREMIWWTRSTRSRT